MEQPTLIKRIVSHIAHVPLYAIGVISTLARKTEGIIHQYKIDRDDKKRMVEKEKKEQNKWSSKNN